MHELWKKIQQRGRRLRPAQLIIFAFAALIALGTLLLSLPVSSVSRESCGGVTALFTATSALCVTGLTVVQTAASWSLFGKTVILCLIQIGGLGFMTIVSVFYFLLHRRIGLKQRMLLAQSLSLNGFDGVVRLVRHALIGTVAVEGAGALILAARFASEMPLHQAIWYGVFHSISAFCNAGFDILGGSSMQPYVTDPLVNVTLIALITTGSLGFFVWEDLRSQRTARIRRLTVHTRIVLFMTVCLLLLGTALFAALEWNNPETIGNLSADKKLLASAFQSVTLRTAGFETVRQGGLTEAAQALSVVYMFIGGSPGSTAGGAKTVTVAVLLLAVLSSLRGRPRVTVCGRTIDDGQVRSALALVAIMVLLIFSGGLFLTVYEDLPFLSCLYEAASALCTVGNTTGITGSLHLPSQILLIIFMFFGRVGIMTISLGFLLSDRAETRCQYAETRVLIG